MVRAYMSTTCSKPLPARGRTSAFAALRSLAGSPVCSALLVIGICPTRQNTRSARQMRSSSRTSTPKSRMYVSARALACRRIQWKERFFLIWLGGLCASRIAPRSTRGHFAEIFAEIAQFLYHTAWLSTNSAALRGTGPLSPPSWSARAELCGRRTPIPSHFSASAGKREGRKVSLATAPAGSTDDTVSLRARRACATTRLEILPLPASAQGARRQTTSTIAPSSPLAYRLTGCCPGLSTSPRRSWATAWNVCEPPMTTRCVPRRHSTRLPPSSSLNAQPPASPSRRLSASSSNRGRADQGRAWSALAQRGRHPVRFLPSASSAGAGEGSVAAGFAKRRVVQSPRRSAFITRCPA
mmetsp:Transcript_37982/g.94237  ORF Transcript_37982/g.94237 Transcript_37982/m.94237 type:complete len:355 (-) Transcript_37982:21-1085(-)